VGTSLSHQTIIFAIQACEFIVTAHSLRSLASKVSLAVNAGGTVRFSSASFLAVILSSSDRGIAGSAIVMDV
jgi:hypothetical protein